MKKKKGDKYVFSGSVTVCEARLDRKGGNPEPNLCLLPHLKEFHLSECL